MNYRRHENRIMFYPVHILGAKATFGAKPPQPKSFFIANANLHSCLVGARIDRDHAE